MLARKARTMRRRLPGAGGCLALVCSALSILAAEPLPSLDQLTLVDQASFNHDASRVVVKFDEKHVGLWEVATGAPIAPNADWQTPCAAFVMSADGRSVLLALGESGARVFDTHSGLARSEKLEVRFRDPTFPQAVFSPDSASVVIFEEKSAAVFTVASGRRVATLPLTAGTAEEELSPSAVFTRDGASCFVIDGAGTVTRYDTKTWQPIGKPLRHPAASSAYSYGLAIDAESRWLATFDGPGENGPKGQLQPWDMATGRAVGKPIAAVNGMAGAFLPAANRLLLTPGRGEASVRELPSLKKLFAIRAHDDVDGPGVAFSPDGQWLVSWGSDRMIRIIEAATGAVKDTHVFHSTISEVFLLPDSRGCLAVFDNTAFLAQDHHDHYVVRIPFGGQIAATLRLTEPLHRTALSPDGRRFLVIAGPTDAERLLFFDATTLKPLAR